MGPRRHWVVLGSFTPCLYSGTLISLLFGLIFSKNLKLGSRKHFLPESPFSPEDRRLHQTIRKILSEVFPRPLCPSPLQIPYHCYIIMDNYIHLSFQSHRSCYYKIPRKFSLLFREYLVPTALQFITHMITPTDNSSHLPSIRPSPVVYVFH